MSKNILLVEYDESTILSIKDIFHPPAFEVVIAGDGETAKQLLRDRHFDLMITAAMLPRFHGFNLALAVSQEHPGIKIIIISAIYKGLEYRHQATTQYRANDFFEKPLEKERLLKRVLELLGMSESDLQPAGASSTRVPQFETAKIPAPKFDDEGDKLSSADIFGDIIQKIEQVPSFEIDLGDGKAAHPPAPPPERRPDPGLTVPLKPPAPKPDLGRTRVAGPSFDLDSLRGTKKPSAPPTPPAAASQQRIDASLDGLKAQPQPKREGVQKEMRRIEDEIARKFEDTLSGLGLGAARKPPAPAARPAPPAPAPAAKTVVMPEIKVAPMPVAPPVMEKPAAPASPPPAARPSAAPPPPPPPAAAAPTPPPAAAAPTPPKGWRDELQDEVIDLGEALLQPPPPAKPAAPPPPPLPAVAPAAKPPAAEEAGEVREPKPEKKAEENPNEVGDYVLLGMIARGGMAEIYKAKKKGVKGFEKVIAIKKILSGYGEDDKYIEMLVDEAKIAAELSHPNIVQIYDLGRKDNYYFIAMEYVLGKDLREIQTRLRERDKWFPEEIAIFLTIKILEALNYAHKAKDSRGRPLDIVHRDVSPPNILISYNGDVKLTDFGVSKASIKIHQTLSGALKGKLLYMSPEQACGESSIDYRSDLYSVGVLLFELLTAKKLFLDTTEMLVLKKVQNGEIINPRDVNPDIDPALEKILLTSLNKECDRRYQSAAAMIADLEAYIHKKYDRAPGPVHLSHFLYGLFENDIQREGIKVDLKPLPYVPRPREVPKPPLAPEKPRAAEPPPPPSVPAAVPEPPRPAPPEGGIRISFDEDKAAAPRKPAAAEKTEFQPEALFHELEKGKKKLPLLPVAAVLLLCAAAAGFYFLVLNKPAAPAGRAAATQAAAAGVQPGGVPAADAAKEAEMKRIADELAATQKLLDEAKQKEEALKKQKAEEDQKKLLDERRMKAEADRLKKEEAARQQQEEEAARLQQQEEERRRQEEADRQKQAEEEKRRAEEQKRAELNRVKEGDIVPLNEVDVQPVAVSTPQPNIPDSIRAAMSGSQTVTFSVLINHNGDVETARMLIKTNNGQLNGILLDTVKSYKFQPAQKNSLRVKVWKSISMSIKK